MHGNHDAFNPFLKFFCAEENKGTNAQGSALAVKALLNGAVGSYLSGCLGGYSLHYKANLFEYIYCGGCLLSTGLSLGQHLLFSLVKGII